ncbi:hypothetical protein [Paracoccus sp. PARArs4]|uniref:hypothetical protein n=1 Tax=Paracoccus sp. PARArs4 TaxID=2853442 RepID=UPI0024A74293|nr:hypothetical protein [Paracoccus sp. PARArs4]
MLAFRLLRHSILQLTGNLGAALTLSVQPLLIAALGIGIGLAARQVFIGGDAPGIAVAAVTIAMAATFVLAFVSLAASWHRFILLDERPRVLRPIGRPELRYATASVKLALLLMLPGLMFVLLGQTLMIALGGGIGLYFVIFMMSGFVLAVFGLRLGIGLAGAATGAERPMTTGWHAGGSHLGVLIVLVLFVQILTMAVNLLLSLPLAGLAELLASLLFGWFNTLLWLSLISTLWGHFVEGRDLR